MLESFLFSRVRVWFVVCLLIAAAIGMIAFGAVVKVASTGDQRYGVVGDVALIIASIPHTAKIGANAVLFGEANDLAAPKRFGTKAGFIANYELGSRPDGEFLLVSRYDGDIRRSVVELLDTNDGAVIHRWQPEQQALDALVSLGSGLIDLPKYHSAERARVMHPLLDSDGSIVFQSMISPLVKIDACGKMVWTIPGWFHHSNEWSADGAIWTTDMRYPQTIDGVEPSYFEDSIVKISKDGKRLFEKTIAEIFLNNDLPNYVYGSGIYSNDPFHINDVQEALSTTEYWEKGDLFLSLRALDMIMNYRPSTNEIVWMKRGPWVKQHDVDFVDETRIAIYNNNRFKRAKGTEVIGGNNVMIYDFATDSVSAPLKDAFASHEVRTDSEGLFTMFPNGDVFAEESVAGRLIKIASDGSTSWEYFNRGADGSLYRMNWSRVVPRGEGNRLAEVLSQTNCQ